MNWKLGKFAGIPINVHWSFWLLPLLVLMSASPAGGDVVFRLAILFLIFGCVILHELGHALMARVFKVRTYDITLYPIGGIARLEHMPRGSLAETAIALAGPAVNVVIAAGLFVLQATVGALLGNFSGLLLQTLIYANVVLVLFNLLPVFPMDGGRVLRALLSAMLPYVQATKIAARIGQGFALLLALAGLYWGSTLILVAVFVFFAAQAELMMVRRQERYAGFAADPFGSGAAQPGPAQSTSAQSASPTSGRYVLLDKRGRVISTYG